MPVLQSLPVLGTGFPERTDPAALVIGPTGLGLSPFCQGEENECESRSPGNEPVLYVADSLNNRVEVITNPLTRTRPSAAGMVLSSVGIMNDPLGWAVAPNSHFLDLTLYTRFLYKIQYM